MCAVVTPKDARFDSQLVIIEELFEESRFRIFIELATHQTSTAESGTGFALRINLNFLLRSLKFPTDDTSMHLAVLVCLLLVFCITLAVVHVIGAVIEILISAYLLSSSTDTKTVCK